jgi:hypothetical protein
VERTSTVGDVIDWHLLEIICRIISTLFI